MQISIGHIVLYTLTIADAAAINRRRTTGAAIKRRIEEGSWPLGVSATHNIGNPASEGQVLPMIVVQDWVGSVNGQVFLDGTDTLWVTSCLEGHIGEPGTWAWAAPVD